MDIKTTGKNFTSASKDDNVYTPYSMTEQLLEHEKFDKDKYYFEPSCGEYAISNVLSKYLNSSHCYSSDILEGFDFLDYPDNYINLAKGFKFNYIITNPPYSKLDKFIAKAKEGATEKFAFLCKLTHLGGVGRFNIGIFKDPNYPLTKIHLFTRQANLRFTNDIQEKKGYISYREIRENGKYPAGMYYYCWLIFENNNLYNDKFYNNFINGHIPVMKWINNNKYILRKSNEFNYIANKEMGYSHDDIS